MEPANWIALAGILATFSIAVINKYLDRNREKLQQERDDRLREEERKREAEIQEKERIHAPQIEFNISCNFYGPHHNAYIAEILLTANNKGRVRQQFEYVMLRIRGIETEQSLSDWKGYEPRLEFPKELVEDVPVIPKKTKYFFAEPNVTTIFTYVTKIPDSVKYILAYATFSYDSENDKTHDAERVFEVKPR